MNQSNLNQIHEWFYVSIAGSKIPVKESETDMIMNKHKNLEEDKYKNFEELKNNETLYEICFVERSSGAAIIAPHGGKIEPGTSEIARAIAGTEHSFYSFNGLKKSGNKRTLHITGINFDEPTAVAIVEQSERVVAIHGCKGTDKYIELGGLDNNLKNLIEGRLSKEFKIKSPKDTRRGESKRNICNRSKNNGVQIEISKGLRDSMFEANTVRGRLRPLKKDFKKFVFAIRESIKEILG